MTGATIGSARDIEQPTESRRRRTDVTLHVAITSPIDLSRGDLYGPMLTAWAGAAPRLLPTHVGLWSPLRQPLDVNDPEATISVWTSGSWLGRRSSPVTETHMMGGALSAGHSTLSVNVPRSANALASEGAALLRAWAGVVSVDHGFVHELTTPERDLALASRRPDVGLTNRVTGAAFVFAGFTRALAAGLPPLYWQTVLGPPYRRLFGDDRIRSTPCHRVDEVGDSLVLVLTPAPPTDASWPDFAAARAAAEQHLGRDAFWPAASRLPSFDVQQPPGLDPLELGRNALAAVQTPLDDTESHDVARLLGTVMLADRHGITTTHGLVLSAGPAPDLIVVDGLDGASAVAALRARMRMACADDATRACAIVSAPEGPHAVRQVRIDHRTAGPISLGLGVLGTTTSPTGAESLRVFHEPGATPR
jgi:hypothetical protein